MQQRSMSIVAVAASMNSSNDARSYAGEKGVSFRVVECCRDTLVTVWG